MTDREPGKATRLVQAGRRKEWRGRLVNAPVARASTILFEVPSADAVSFIGVGLVLLVTSLAACAVPALRASRLSPLDALRELPSPVD